MLRIKSFKNWNYKKRNEEEMLKNSIVWEESYIKKNIKHKSEESSNKNNKNDKDREWKWCEQTDKQSKEKDFKNNNKSVCKLNLEEICLKNSQKKINYNNLHNKNEGWSNRNTRDKYKGYGCKDFRPIDVKNKENNNNTQRLWKIKDGNKNKSRNKNKDY